MALDRPLDSTASTNAWRVLGLTLPIIGGISIALISIGIRTKAK